MTLFAVILVVGGAHPSLPPGPATALDHTDATGPNVAVAPQYDTTHVYVAPADFNRFVASVVATFGGTTSMPSRKSEKESAARCCFMRGFPSNR